MSAHFATGPYSNFQTSSSPPQFSSSLSPLLTPTIPPNLDSSSPEHFRSYPLLSFPLPHSLHLRQLDRSSRPLSFPSFTFTQRQLYSSSFRPTFKSFSGCVYQTLSSGGTLLIFYWQKGAKVKGEGDGGRDGSSIRSFGVVSRPCCGLCSCLQLDKDTSHSDYLMLDDTRALRSGSRGANSRDEKSRSESDLRNPARLRF